MGDLFLDALDRSRRKSTSGKREAWNPSPAQARTKLAEALRLQGRFDEAVDELHEALRIDPTSARAHSGLGLALRGQRRTTRPSRNIVRRFGSIPT